jgi:chemotaxis protein CheZ
MSAQPQPQSGGAPQSALQIKDAHGYLERLIRELHALGSERKQPLVTVLEYVAHHIALTREEVGALRPDGSSSLSCTADELEEIVNETAKAANEIMGAAESIETIAAGTDPRTREALQAAATRIYEASAFQDITGQRITKVVRALQHIESRVEALSRACGAAVASSKAIEAVSADASLLNGPQLGRNAATQSEIDSLFDSVELPS